MVHRAWEPPHNPNDHPLISFYKSDGHNLPAEAWHMLFVLAAIYLHRAAIHGARPWWEKLAEDYSNFRLSWASFGYFTDGEISPGRREWMTDVFREMEKPQRPKARRWGKRKANVTPAMVLLIYNTAQAGVTAIKSELLRDKKRYRRYQFCEARLRDLISEITRRHFHYTVIVEQVPDEVVKSVEDQRPADVAVMITSLIVGASEGLIEKKKLPEARKLLSRPSYRWLQTQLQKVKPSSIS